jgi:hypothetical protein
MCTSIGRRLGNILWITCHCLLIYSIFSSLDSSFAQDLPLRISEPVDSVIADLKSYEEKAREIVFNPLGMSGSSFVNEAGVMTSMANGHMRYLLTLMAFLIPFIWITAFYGTGFGSLSDRTCESSLFE